MSSGRTEEFHSVHRLIRALGRDPAVQQKFGEDPQVVFDSFELTATEVAALKDGSIAALAGIGVNPIMRMHWLMMSKPEAAAHMSVAEYLAKFGAGAADD